MNPLLKLKKIAVNREHAFRISGHMDLAKAQAITKIKRIADFFGTKEEQAQLKVVLQIKNEVLLIIPSEGSKYQNVRKEAIEILLRAAALA